MKRLFSPLLILILIVIVIVIPAHAGTQITATLVVTNVAANSNTVTFNSADIRTATTNVPVAATQWAVTNTAAWTATNLLAHLANYPPLGGQGYVAQKSGTNDAALWIIAPVGSNLSVVVTGTWARVHYVTNTFANTTNVLVPVAALPALSRSNITSGLIEWLNQNPAAAAHIVSNIAPAFVQFLNNSTNWQNYTNKNFRNGTNTFGYIAGAGGQMSNVGIVNLTATNFSSPSTGALSVAVGASSAAGEASTAIGHSAVADGLNAAALGAYAVASGSGGAAVGNGAEATGYGSIAIGADAVADAWGAAAFGTAAFALHSNSTAIGYSAETTTTNQVRIGTSAETISIPGHMTVAGTSTLVRAEVSTAQIGTLSVTGAVSSASLTATNSITSATGTITGPLTVGSLKALGSNSLNGLTTNSGVILDRSATISTLAAGNNIIVRPTNNYVELSATAGAATLCAITNGFGDGDHFTARNGTGYALTIAHESGFTSIAANRIRCVNGASNVTVFPGGMMSFWYSAADSRWLCLYPEVFSATATNAIASVNGQGSNTFLIAPVLAASATDTNTTNGYVLTASGTNGAWIWAPASGSSGDSVLSNIVRAADVALTNRADTNYVLVNNLSNALNAANVALSNLSYAIGMAATNFTLSIATNYITTANGLGTNTTLTNALLQSYSVGPQTNFITYVSNGFMLTFRATNGAAVGAPVMVVNQTNGNAGIGTNAPEFGLHLAGVTNSLLITVPSNSATPPFLIDFSESQSGGKKTFAILPGTGSAPQLMQLQMRDKVGYGFNIVANVANVQQEFGVQNSSGGAIFSGTATTFGTPALVKIGGSASMTSSAFQGNTHIAAPSAGTLVITNGTAGGAIAVGIGTASPLARLHVSGGHVGVETNAFPTWCTNGMYADWNSNGTSFRVTSRRLGTNQIITFLAPEP